MPTRRRSRFLLWLLIVLSAAGCIALVFSSNEDERVFTVRGIIRAPYADGEISVQHEEIPDFMPAMTMPFYTNAAEAGDLVPGDIVEFEFRVGEESRASNFRTIGRAESAVSKPPAGAAFQRLRPGDVMPDFKLIDQDGQTITAADLRGRETILTFIFTRCPVPEFCPLIGKKFQALQQKLPEGDEGPRLLSITIDPEFDRPAVLREYGEALNADFERWRFATGTPDQVKALTKLFAVRTENNGTSLDHTLATALIGKDGNVVEIWRGNAWKPEEVLAKIGG